MAIAVQKDGACQIKIASPHDGTLEELGYTRNGVDPEHDGFYSEVHGDQNGGDEGPPIDIQYFGEIARVRIELTKFDLAVFEKIRRRVPSATTAGTPAAPGVLMFAAEDYFRLLLNTASNPMNFTRAIPRSAISYNKSTKWKTASCEFECHKDENGVLWNVATT